MMVRAIRTTADGKLVQGRAYKAKIGYSPKMKSRSGVHWRIIICDEQGVWTPFDPAICEPYVNGKMIGCVYEIPQQDDYE